MSLIPRGYARTIAKRIWEGDITKVVDLDKAVQVSLAPFRVPFAERASVAYKIADDVDSIIAEFVENAIRRGLIPKFRRSKSSRRYIGSAVTPKKNIINGTQLKERLGFLGELKVFVNEITWEQFEGFCEYVVRLYGPSRAGLGQKTRDGGLDFYATFLLSSVEKSEWWYTTAMNGRPSSWRGLFDPLEVRVFGQAKHRKVDEKEVNDFSMKIKDFRERKGMAIKQLPDSFVKSSSPLLPMIFTNRAFTTPARNRANNELIVLRDGDQIAQDIIVLDSKYAFDGNPTRLRLDRLLKRMKKMSF
jgi:hypothetical protein